MRVFDILVKLYTAYSVVNNYRGRNHVTFLWYCQQRPAAVVTYSEAIADFDGLAARGQRVVAERYLDSLFTDEEIQTLRAYLAAEHGTELFAQRVDLPLTWDRCRHWPQDDVPQEEGTGLYMLSREERYDLPFVVWARYDLRDCPLTTEAECEMQRRVAGVTFLQQALALLGVGAGIDERRLDRAVAQLYASQGFSVTQHSCPSGAADSPDSPPSEPGANRFKSR